MKCQELLDRANVGTFELSLEGELLDCNDACARILGQESREDLIATGRLPFTQHSDFEMLLESIRDIGELHGIEVNMARPDGTELWTNQNLVTTGGDAAEPKIAGPAEPKTIIGTMIDVTDARASIWDLEHQAQHDPATGLPNRAMTLEQLNVALTTARRSKDPVAVILFEIDGFDEMVEKDGFGAAERVLKEVATRLYEQARASDVVGRFSQKQIALVLTRYDEDVNALSVTNRMLADIARPIVFSTTSIEVTASAGVAMYPEDAISAETLTHLAGEALSRALEQGGDTCRLYEQARNDATFERAFLISSVGNAIETGQFSLRYQPLIDVRTGRIECLETSIRWNHPRMGLLEPEKFIPLLDRIEASVKLGHWAAAEAARQLAEWKELGLDVPRLALNLSTAQMDTAELGRTMQLEIESAKLSPELFQVEVPERALCARPRTMMMTSELTERGFSVAIDDFGTGGCSLMDLKHLNVASLKIDRSFVHQIGEDQDKLGIVHGIVTMGRALGKEIIADGVATQQQLAALRSLDCALMQGDYLGAPLPAGETSDLLQMQH